MQEEADIPILPGLRGAKGREVVRRHPRAIPAPRGEGAYAHALRCHLGLRACRDSGWLWLRVACSWVGGYLRAIVVGQGVGLCEAWLEKSPLSIPVFSVVLGPCRNSQLWRDSFHTLRAPGRGRRRGYCLCPQLAHPGPRAYDHAL